MIGVVVGEINFTKYSSTSVVAGKLISLLINTLTSITCVLVFYLLFKFFKPSYLEKLSRVETKRILLSLGIGLACLIAIPLLCVLLFILKVTASLGIILLLIYLLLLLVSVPTLLIAISEFVKSKLSNSLFNSFVCLICVTILYGIVKLIPYVGFVFGLLFVATGVGTLVINLKKDKTLE